MLSVLTSVALGILPYVRPILPAAQEYRGMGTSSLDIDPAGPIDVPPRTVTTASGSPTGIVTVPSPDGATNSAAPPVRRGRPTASVEAPS
jgi:hypothetical protein